MSLSVKIILPQFIFLIISLGSVFSQTTIAKQSFETSGDTWIPMTLSTPSCTSGDDIWDFSTTINTISANDGSQFWGIADLNGSCGGSGFESITLPNINVSLYTSVNFSFDYNVFGFDNGDDLKYELFYDNVSQGEVIVVDGTSNLTTPGWVTETVSVPGTVTNVSVILYAKQNGAGDYGGFDNVFLEGTTVTCSPSTEPTSSSNTLNFSDIQCDELTFDWINGNGSNRIVVISTSAISGTPNDQTDYTANSTFGSGSTIAANEFVVYNGSGNSVNVTGLSLNTNYFISIFEYNGTTANCTENYLTTTSLTGSQITLAVCAATCPQVKSILVNACGVSSNEGLDEYIVFKNGSSNLAIDDISIEFPNPNGTYCNSGCGTKTLGNNASYTSSLNTTAGCSKFAYLDPIPAEATVIIFTGQTPSFSYDFSSMCAGGEQVAVIFCSNTNGGGRYGNSSNANRSTTLTWGSCSQTATFYSSSANTGDDGDFANFDASGAVTYSNNGDCLASPLPAEINYFEANKTIKGVQLTWETWSEFDADYFEISRSYNGVDYELFSTVKANGFSNETIIYSTKDDNSVSGDLYYQLNLVNYDGIKEELGNTVFNYKTEEVSVINKENRWELYSSETKEGIINIYNMNGVLLKSIGLKERLTSISNVELSEGIYIIELKSNNLIWNKKVIK